jgi:hypothetical protein
MYVCMYVYMFAPRYRQVILVKTDCDRHPRHTCICGLQTKDTKIGRKAAQKQTFVNTYYNADQKQKYLLCITENYMVIW